MRTWYILGGNPPNSPVLLQDILQGHGTARRAVWITLLCLLGPLVAGAQQPPTHPSRGSDMPPGAIGSRQLLRGGPLVGYSQPVEIRAPAGTRISAVRAGQFISPQPAPLKVGLQIGEVYRFEVSHIPLLEFVALYPTIEVIDRTYPPEGSRWRFPIPVEITQEELHLAASGKLVTRVVYIEDPLTALAIAENEDSEQRYFEVSPREDPLTVAESLGRPAAIMRIGARAPGSDGPDESFVFGSPPLEIYSWQGNTNALRPTTTATQSTPGEGSTTQLFTRQINGQPMLPVSQTRLAPVVSSRDRFRALPHPDRAVEVSVR